MPGSPESELLDTFASELLSTETIFNELAVHLLEVENNEYRSGALPPIELKLLFLIGGDDQDLKSERDFSGKRIYTKSSSNPFPKTPEILETASAISSYFERLENEGYDKDISTKPADITHIASSLSEIGDITWNLAQLTTLDPQFAGNYHYGINRIADSLGYTRRHILILSYEKYHLRMTTQKNLNAEEKLIIRLMKKGIIPVPQNQQVADVYRTINEMATKVIRKRLQELQGNIIVY